MDSPDARADIRRKSGEAAAAKITKKREGTCRRPPATSTCPRELSSASDMLRSSSRELRSLSELDAVEVQHASVEGEEDPRHGQGVEIYLQQAHHACLHLGGHVMGEGKLSIGA